MIIDQTDKRYADKVIEGNYGLWNALLTLNGILLSVFSVIAIFIVDQKSTLLFLLIISCGLSSAMIILNYTSIRDTYRYLGSLSVEQNIKMDLLSEDIKKG